MDFHLLAIETQKCECRLEIMLFSACRCLCSVYPFESGEVTA